LLVQFDQTCLIVSITIPRYTYHDNVIIDERLLISLSLCTLVSLSRCFTIFLMHVGPSVSSKVPTTNLCHIIIIIYNGKRIVCRGTLDEYEFKYRRKEKKRNDYRLFSKNAKIVTSGRANGQFSSSASVIKNHILTELKKRLK